MKQVVKTSMRTMFILRGLPGSGKSIVAAEMVRKEPKRFIRINRDDLRAMASGPGNDPRGNREREDTIRSFKDELIRKAFKDGYDVILDDTHLVPSTVKKLHDLAHAFGNVTVIEKCINVPVEECVRRDSLRTGFAKVGSKVINDMARAAGLDRGRALQNKEIYYEPRAGSMGVIAYEHDAKLPSAILCDLDGTLAIINDRSPYDATNCDIKDLPNWPVIKTVMAMHASGVRIVFMSGRDVQYRPETVRFIEKYCRNGDDVIPYELHMRGEADLTKRDSRKDSIIKEELFVNNIAGKYNVLFVLDDRNQVVCMWRQIGLTVFQVAEGNF